MRKIEQPFFLVGSIRSGTSLLRLMLDGHPDIAFNLESEYLVSQLPKGNGFPDVVEYVSWLEHDRVFQHSRFSINKELDYVSLMNDFLWQKKEREGKSIIGATVHDDFGELKRIWPNAKYIHIYRDGRDVSNSVMQMGLTGNAYMAADYWLKAEHEWNELANTLSPSDYINISYEDLICDAKNSLEGICNFIRVSYSEHMFDYANDSTYGLPDPKFTYQWKIKSKANDVQRIESKINGMLLQRGYDLSINKPIKLGGLTKRYLHFNSKINALLFRINKYGVNLVLQEMVSRRFNFIDWNISVSRKIDVITDNNLK